jgi:hypothetical protein
MLFNGYPLEGRFYQGIESYMRKVNKLIRFLDDLDQHSPLRINMRIQEDNLRMRISSTNLNTGHEYLHKFLLVPALLQAYFAT